MAVLLSMPSVCSESWSCRCHAMIYFAGGAAGVSIEGLPHLAVQLTVHSASIA